MKKEFKKGDLVRFNGYSMNHSIYMVIDKLENNKYYLIRVKRKDRRFDIKRTLDMTLDIKSDFASLVDIKDLNLDIRDLEIFNDFHNYILNNNKFKIKFESYTTEHKYGKDSISITYFRNIVISNLNLSKYKKYSNNL